MLTFICPCCNTEIPAEARAIGSLPPTGGDYEWQEGENTHTCPHCSNSFVMRVRTSIESGSLLFINSSPKPIHESIIWYAIAEVESSLRGNKNELSIYVSKVFKDKATAQAKLPEHAKRHYAPLQILKVSKDGYFDLSENELSEPSYYKPIINYLELR